MKLIEILLNENGPHTVDEITVDMVDPITNDEVTMHVSVELYHDDGDVGHGVGPGNSPHQPRSDIESMTVTKELTLGGKVIKVGREFDPSELVKHMTPGQVKRFKAEVEELESGRHAGYDHDGGM